MEKTHRNLQENNPILATFLQILIAGFNNSASIHAVCKNISGPTIWLGFGDEKFRNLISKSKPEKESPFMGVSAAFAHFVVVQLLALLSALWALAMNFPTPDFLLTSRFSALLIASGHFFGFFLFVYSLMSTLAATMGVFRTASWYDSYKKKPTPLPQQIQNLLKTYHLEPNHIPEAFVAFKS